MSSIVTNDLRVGSFTSSEVYLLIPLGTRAMTKEELEVHKEAYPNSKKKNCDDIKGFQKSGLTYIKKKYYERRLKRSLDTGAYGRDMAWGLFLETYVYSHFSDLGYKLLANVTHKNPNVNNHAGSTDLLKPKVKVGDVKCYQPLGFCEFAEVLEQQSIDVFKKERPKEYWQLVSNSVIHNVPKAEAILYMPKPEELEEIKTMACDYEGSDMWKYRFIYESENYELAYVPNDSDYDSKVSFEFTVPQEDKDFLMERLEIAEKVLQQKFKK